MANQQTSKLSQPSVRAFDLPVPLITPQFSPVLEAPLLVVLSLRHDQLNPASLPSFSQIVAVIAAVCNYSPWFLSRSAFCSGAADFGERGVRKRNFCRRGTFQPNSQRNTFTVSKYHPLCALTTLCFTNGRASFLLARNCHPERIRPISAGLQHQVRQVKWPSSEPDACLFPHTPG